MDYRIDSIIEYAGGANGRIVRVTYASRDIKDGDPGFDGVIVVDNGSDRVGDPVWGYDDQVKRVIQF